MTIPADPNGWVLQWWCLLSFREGCDKGSGAGEAFLEDHCKLCWLTEGGEWSLYTGTFSLTLTLHRTSSLPETLLRKDFPTLPWFIFFCFVQVSFSPPTFSIFVHERGKMSCTWESCALQWEAERAKCGVLEAKKSYMTQIWREGEKKSISFISFWASQVTSRRALDEIKPYSFPES